jgi:hypothetical protein
MRLTPGPHQRYTSSPEIDVGRDPAAIGADRVVPALLAQAEADGSVRCVACAHRCLIRPGRRGICLVRENRGCQLVSLV